MNIVIPSKNIYSIDFDPVIDNQIDKVEVGTKNVVPDNHYSETVYNEDVYSGFVSNSQDIQDKQSQLFKPVVNINNPIVYAYAAAIYADGQYYLSKNIKIPIRPDNTHLITSLLLGINKEGEKNIRYSCKGKINKGTTNASILLVASINGVAVQSWSTTLISPINNGYFKSEETTGNFTIADKDSVTITNDDGSISLTAEIEILTIDNLATVEASEITIDGKKYFSLDLQNILCGIRITKGGGRITAMPVSAQNKTALSGSIGGLPYIEYVPEVVTITVYGNTIGIDLQDETVTIGNGNKVFSFDGNELIQKTNTPTLESRYQKIVDNWKDGKKTAKVTCSISDYYDQSGNIIISPTSIKNNYTYSNPITIEIIDYDSLIENTMIARTSPILSGQDIKNNKFIYAGEKDKKAIIFSKTTTQNLIIKDVNSTYFERKIGRGELTSYRNITIQKVPMMFNIGDIVIPYAYTNQGDKPVAYNKDFTPKKFKVVGTKRSKKQGAMQELTLQEV